MQCERQPSHHCLNASDAASGSSPSGGKAFQHLTRQDHLSCERCPDKTHRQLISFPVKLRPPTLRLSKPMTILNICDRVTLLMQEERQESWAGRRTVAYTTASIPPRVQVPMVCTLAQTYLHRDYVKAKYILFGYKDP